ncbi:MAG: YkgJ family cysteine cluster protein [Myxococcota bacterium]
MDAESAYAILVEKVDSFFAAAMERGADLRCGSGCSGCCQVELTVSAIEAAGIRRLLREAPRQPEGPAGACVFLDVEGRCQIYDARPLVCRSQGLPLSYPPDVVPVDAVRGTLEDRDLTWCPLNFTERPPNVPDVLDAARADEALAQINRHFCTERGIDPLWRVSLRTLHAER